jgi:RNA polymerase sigma factor (sigma-70 family)
MAMDRTQLLKGLAKGDASAQRCLYDRHAPLLYAVCLRYMPDEALAQDCLQEAFITIFRKIGELRDDKALEGWMKRVTVNTCLMELRRRRDTDIRIDELNGEVPLAFDSDPVAAMSANELLEVICQLPDGLREVFNLFAIEGYPHQEIATMLSITEVNSKVRLNRARGILRGKLDKLGITAHHH